MKKALLLLTILFAIFLGACSKADVIEDNPEINCDLTPTIEECQDDNNEQPVTTDNLLEQDLTYVDYDAVFNQASYDQLMVRVNAVLDTLTLEEKAAQMVQAERGYISPSQVEQYGVGSILSGGGSHPSSYNDSANTWYQMYEDYQEGALASSSGIPLIYGIDAVHGNNNLYGATIFPHNIGLGAANDPQLVYDISAATAEEMLATGITWTFAPALSVVQNIRWGRSYEGYSENPLIHDRLTYQAILGFQENGVSASAKHFLADGGTLSGIDQGNVTVAEEIIRSIHLAPYLEAVKADVDTVMISFSSIDGVKMHENGAWVNDVLKDELGFKGFVISDWNAIHQLPGSFETQVASSINAGVDMLMEPQQWLNTINAIVNNVNNERITIERIDDAVSRILYIKFKQGLFDDPYQRLQDDVLYNDDHQELARDAVRKSLVLLKNEDQALPLDKNDSIYITGPGADHVGYMTGGWTTYWQGNTNANIGVGTTILDAMTSVLNNNGGHLVNNVDDANTVIVVLTELPYAEGVGDNGSLTLTSGNAHPDNDDALQLAKTAHADGKTVIGILLSGRPLLLEHYLDDFDAFVAAWLPGTEGGNGISDVLFGDFNFTGTLSFTWPIDFAQVGTNTNDEDYDEDAVQFPFGYGLHYVD